MKKSIFKVQPDEKTGSAEEQPTSHMAPRFTHRVCPRISQVVAGHHLFHPQKACPCFDAAAEYADLQPK